MKTKVIQFVTGLLLIGSLSANAAPILDVNTDGKLVGAQNVLVDSILYDVQFLDGTCINRFSGCDSPDDFLFNTFSLATLATQALLDQVFVDVGGFLFDSTPANTFGCTFTTCTARTPWQNIVVSGATKVDVRGAVNKGGALLDVIDDIQTFPGAGTITGQSATWAVWSLAPPSVPEPPTMSLLAIALAGLGFARGRARQHVV